MYKISAAALLFIFFCSCAFFDAPMRFAGLSVQKFEKKDRGRHSQFFEMTKKESFGKTLNFIKNIKARVTRKSYRKGYITAFDFAKSFDYCLDSTEAAFFIEETGENKVKITVICNNSLLAENLSEKYFKSMSELPQEKQDKL